MRIQHALLLTMTLLPCAAHASEVEDIHALTKDRGGLVVHVDCGDGTLTVALGKREGVIVQGLTRDADQVAPARRQIHADGLSGPVTIRLWTTQRLPYADGVVNVLIASKAIAEKEAARVLAPGGVLLIRGNLNAAAAGLNASGSSAGWQSFVKPVPAEMDEWTHYLHGADNNAVANDSLVGPPRYLRWDGGPKYGRNHEIDASVISAVTGGGRLFYVVDEGPAGTMGQHLPQKWALIARDAFSGVILWRRPVPNMGWPAWKPSLGREDWRGANRSIIHVMITPSTLPRRLVVDGDRLYTSLGYHAPLVALDAKTGTTIKTWEEVAGVDEIVVQGSTIFVVNRPQNRASYDKQGDSAWSKDYPRTQMEYPGEVVALDRNSCEVLWRSVDKNLDSLSLTATPFGVIYHNGKAIVCLDPATGKPRWKTPSENSASYRFFVNHTILAHDDVLLVGTPSRIEAYSLKTGEKLWEGRGARKGFVMFAPPDLYVIDDLVFAPRGGKTLAGLNLQTGEEERTISLPRHLYTPLHHTRCYRGKATERYILENKRGIEMIGMDGESFYKHDWVRGMCRYGVLPANGLIYSLPHPCACYAKVMLNGFNALASTRQPRIASTELRTGPAFGTTGPVAGKGDWPTFRGNPIRSGHTATTVSAKPSQTWTTQLAGKLTQPIVAAGKIFVVSVHQQMLYALDEATGKTLWQYSADARIDSPPTYHKGVLYFGTRSGRILALSAADGREVWQHRIAPTEEQIVSYNQLESVWPVHGSTLIVDDVVYAAAGRSGFLDGGIYAVGLDCATGKLRYKAHFNSEQQDTDRKGGGDDHFLDGFAMDIMQYDGTDFFLGNLVLDKALQEQKKVDPKRLHASGGFLDDLTWNRDVWTYSSQYPSFWERKLHNHVLSGQLLVHDQDLLWGIEYFLDTHGKSSLNYPGATGYQLFAASLKVDEPDFKQWGKKKGNRKIMVNWNRPRPGVVWQSKIPLRVRAMVKAGEILFVAGPPDGIDTSDPLGPYEGRGKALLRTFGSKDGKPEAEITLPGQPVFDGMVAANGNLYIAHTSGALSCWR